MVRVSPNELSFASAESWKAIYGHRTTGAAPVVKSEFYDIYGAGFKSLCIGSERDPHKHGKMRKMLSAAFSTKMLLDQEDIITKTVDAFVHRLGEDVFQSEGLNMTKWFEMIAFDSLGEMAFGESFHSVKAGKFGANLREFQAQCFGWEVAERRIISLTTSDDRKATQLVGDYSEPSILHHTD